MTDHMHILKITKPNDTNATVSTPVGEACQWAHDQITLYRKMLTASPVVSGEEFDDGELDELLGLANALNEAAEHTDVSMVLSITPSGAKAMHHVLKAGLTAIRAAQKTKLN